MTSVKTSLHFLKNEQEKEMLKEQVLDFLNENSKFTKEEKIKFANCYLQENSIESTAYKLNKSTQEVSFLYYFLTTNLARIALSSFLKN